MVAIARRWRPLVLGVGLALLLAACGDDSGTGSGGNTATTAAVAVDQALAAKVPDAIKSDGTIKVGTDSTYAPNEFPIPTARRSSASTSTCSMPSPPSWA